MSRSLYCLCIFLPLFGRLLSDRLLSIDYFSSLFGRLLSVAFVLSSTLFVVVFLVVCFWAVRFLAFILSSAFSRLLSVVRLSEIYPVPFGDSPSLSNSSPFNQCCVVNFFPTLRCLVT